MEAAVLMEASFQWGEKDALAKCPSGSFGFQGNLCPPQKCQVPSLYFRASGLSCLIIRDIQASPRLSSPTQPAVS